MNLDNYEKTEFFEQNLVNAKFLEQIKLSSYRAIEIDTLNINFLTYNLFLRPPLVKTNEDDYKNERLKLFMQKIDKFDIICLQEVFSIFNSRKQKIINSAMKKGFLFFAESPTPPFFSKHFSDGGLLTISKYPILAKEYFPFRYNVLSDALCQKGLLYTQIKIYNEVFHLFNLHTQASYIGKKDDVDAALLTRINQYFQIRKSLVKCLQKHKSKPNELVIIIGDLNLNSRNPLSVESILNSELFPSNNEIYNCKNEYELFTRIITNNFEDDIIDILKKKFSEELPPTYGVSFINKEGKEDPIETTLTHKDDLMSNQTLDFILQFIPKETKEPNVKNISSLFNSKRKNFHLEIDLESIKVEPFFVEDQPFKTLSDHYGLSGSILYKNSPTNTLAKITTNNEIEDYFKIDIK